MRVMLVEVNVANNVVHEQIQHPFSSQTSHSYQPHRLGSALVTSFLPPCASVPSDGGFVLTCRSSSSRSYTCASAKKSVEVECFRHNHTVGVLGGYSTATTVEFLRRLVAATPDKLHIPLLMCSDPSSHPCDEINTACEDFSACSHHQATRTLRSDAHGNAASTKEQVQHIRDLEKGFEGSSHAVTLLHRRSFLERAGAKLIVMPCHVSHIWYKELASDGCAPFLNMADCVANELEAKHLRPLEGGSRVKIGILSNQPIIAAGFYQEALNKQDFDVVVPDKATMEHTVIPGIQALKRKDMEGARNLLRIAVQLLLVSAVNVVVLACDDMCTAFAPDDPLLKRCIDPVDSVVRATIKWARTAKYSEKQEFLL